MKTSELEGAELDYWVAKAKGYKAALSKTHPEHGYAVYEDSISCWVYVPVDEEDEDIENCWTIFEPSWMWHEGGPIIEKEGINTKTHVIENGIITSWKAGKEWPAKELKYLCGPTLLIAAMRAYVASKFGDEVSDDK